MQFDADGAQSQFDTSFDTASLPGVGGNAGLAGTFNAAVAGLLGRSGNDPAERTAEAVESMENATRVVVDGARIADAAGQALNEIENTSEELSGQIGKMASIAQHQSESAKQLASLMNHLRRETEKTFGNQRQSQRPILD